MPADLLDVAIHSVGARGDGIVESEAGRLYVPFAAPGDRLRVRTGKPRGEGRAAAIVQILEPGPDRVAAACRHFGRCGGCALQHLAPTAIAALKREFVQTAFSRRGLADALVADTVTIPPGTRRRIRVTLRRAGKTALGFNERGSRRVLGIGECPVTDPALVALLEPLRQTCEPLDVLGRAADLQLTRTDSGVDLLVCPARPSEPDLAAREALAGLAEEHDLCRVAWETAGDSEPIAARRPALMRFAGTPVALPPGAFLQPSAGGEAAIRTRVIEALAEAKAARVADCYAGCGTLTLPIAATAAVHAVEGDAAMAGALRAAIRNPELTGKVSVEQRDLVRDPVPAEALNGFDAVVFDPPRAGARPLAEALARSDVATVVAVSCNPATLARDARLLVDGGYRVARVTPIDQFAWSAHVEAVAVLRR